jgi:hypothetical protein
MNYLNLYEDVNKFKFIDQCELKNTIKIDNCEAKLLKYN